MEISTFELAKAIRRCIARVAAEVMVYNNWPDGFVVEQMREIESKVQAMDEYRPVDPSCLTVAEMEELDFGVWSEDAPMRLIPLWLFPFLAEDIEVISISGKHIHSKSEMDTDNRFGYLAYGVIPKDCLE